MSSKANILTLFNNAGFYGVAKQIYCLLSAKDLFALASARFHKDNDDDEELFLWLFRQYEVCYPAACKRLMITLNFQRSMSFETAVLRFAIQVLDQQDEEGWVQTWCAASAFVSRIDYFRVLDLFELEFDFVASLNENGKVNFIVRLSEADADSTILTVDLANQFAVQLRCGAQKPLLAVSGIIRNISAPAA